MHTDPIADLLTRIRNAAKAHHQSVTIPYSKIKEEIVKVLAQKEFLESYEVKKEGGLEYLEVTLKETRRDIHLERVSKPGQRIYIKNGDLKIVRNGLGIQILSTPKGVMSNVEAKKNKVGGELLCEIY